LGSLCASLAAVRRPTSKEEGVKGRSLLLRGGAEGREGGERGGEFPPPQIKGGLE